KTVPDVKVFPNPTTGTVNFSQEVRHVEVYDNMGRRVLSDDNTYTLDLSAMRKGLYTLRLTTEQGTVLRKVIKQR
ncbi:MAG: T9SS type A sorting domain-containing protein, partial [Bacteroidales bacterium]|nr:T9SS type A sorting domain-containing protein [Bacteroidales bacterium]